MTAIFTAAPASPFGRVRAMFSGRWITLLGDLDLGEIEKLFAGAATQAGTAAKGAFDRAFEDNPLAVRDLGLNNIAREALASANTYRTAASDLAANGALLHK